MKAWVWLITEERLKSLKQLNEQNYNKFSYQKCSCNHENPVKTIKRIPQAAQRREPLQRLEQGYPKELGLVSAEHICVQVVNRSDKS